MRKFNFLIIGLLFVGLSGLTSCKKESKIERNLWNKGGEWNIDKYQENYGFGADPYSETRYNFGTIKFEKDGNGKITLKDEGETFSNLFTYKNTDNSLTLTYKEGQMHYEGDVDNFTLDWEKDKIELYSYKSDAYGYDEIIMTLSKK